MDGVMRVRFVECCDDRQRLRGAGDPVFLVDCVCPKVGLPGGSVVSRAVRPLRD
jgi:hypothetical protein